jgi:hypothetical protein
MHEVTVSRDPSVSRRVGNDAIPQVTDIVTGKNCFTGARSSAWSTGSHFPVMAKRSGRIRRRVEKHSYRMASGAGPVRQCSGAIPLCGEDLS